MDLSKIAHQLRVSLFSLAVISCQSNTPLATPIQGTVNETLALRVGQEVVFDGGALSLYFETVSEDSRCPTRVTCVWEGNARLRLQARGGGTSAPIELNTNLNPRTSVIRGYEIRLERLDPYPDREENLKQADYIAYLRVQRLPQ
jgi:hypothetical protein